MRNGESVRRPPHETERGAGPATSGPPASSAHREIEVGRSHLTAIRPSFGMSDGGESGSARSTAGDASDDALAAEELEVERAYRLRLANARRLPRSERQAALKAARLWVMGERKRLRDKRASLRRLHRTVRRQIRSQPPGGYGVQ